MQTFITVLHLFTCSLLILVILIQSGKGAEISASFGGSSQTVFGSSGGANFFTRFTAGAAAVFMLTSLTLTVLGGHSHKSLFEDAAPAKSQPISTVPATTSPAAPAHAMPAHAIPAPSGAAAPSGK